MGLPIYSLSAPYFLLFVSIIIIDDKFYSDSVGGIDGRYRLPIIIITPHLSSSTPYLLFNPHIYSNYSHIIGRGSCSRAVNAVNWNQFDTGSP